MIVIFVMGYWFISDSARNSMTNGLEKTRKDYQWDVKADEKETNSTKLWNFMHNQLRCCGVHKPEDWQNSTLEVSRPADELPESCCSRARPKLERPNGKCTKVDAANIGCVDMVVGVVAVFLGIGLILDMYFLLLGCLAFMVARQYETDTTGEQANGQKLITQPVQSVQLSQPTLPTYAQASPQYPRVAVSAEMPPTPVQLSPAYNAAPNGTITTTSTAATNKAAYPSVTAPERATKAPLRLASYKNRN